MQMLEKMVEPPVRGKDPHVWGRVDDFFACYFLVATLTQQAVLMRIQVKCMSALRLWVCSKPVSIQSLKFRGRFCLEMLFLMLV